MATTQQDGVAMEPTPPSTLGYGARELADDTRQAQMQVANDAPVDVNPNAIIARLQAQTIAQIGAATAANADVREKIQDQFLGRLGLK